jgi:hypothetical protein
MNSASVAICQWLAASRVSSGVANLVRFCVSSAAGFAFNMLYERSYTNGPKS